VSGERGFLKGFAGEIAKGERAVVFDVDDDGGDEALIVEFQFVHEFHRGGLSCSREHLSRRG